MRKFQEMMNFITKLIHVLPFKEEEFSLFLSTNLQISSFTKIIKKEILCSITILLLISKIIHS